MTDDRKIISLIPKRLTPAAFAPFGDVISTHDDGNAMVSETMNGQAFNRYLNLAHIDIGDAPASRAQIGLVECNEPEHYPYMLTAMEKHPQSSQLFYPLFKHDYLVAVAPAAEKIESASIELFQAASDQGINYSKNTWHMPMLGIAKGDKFLMVERNDMHLNCDVYEFPDYQLKIELPDQIIKTIKANEANLG